MSSFYTPPNVRGTDKQIQYNEDGVLSASSDLTWDDSAKELGVGGDINLDSGGTYSTTLQMVTPTANRTISFPDATGTVALVSGSNGTVQYNDAGTLKGNSDFTVDPDWNDASTVFTGLKLNVTNTASAAGSNLLDLQVGGSNKFTVDPSGQATFYTAIFSGGGVEKATNFFFGPTNDLRLYRDAAGILAQRNGTNAQTFRLYNTYTDASNYERTSITRDSSGLVIDAQKGGTGADPTNLLDLQVGGSSKFAVGSVGNTSTSFALRIGGSVALWSPYGGTLAIGAVGNSPALSFEGALGAGFTSTALLWWTANPSTGAYSQRDIALARDAANVLKVTDGSTGTGYLRQVPITVSSLPTAAAGNAGTRIFVSDASVAAAGNFGSVVAGGGSNTVPVYSDGGAWRIG